MKRPILIWITSRSRSSMVSKMFINHGVWWGETRWKVSGGLDPSYTTYENIDIKNLLQRCKGRFWHKIHLTPVSHQEFFCEKLSKIVPSDKTWMMKTGVEYFNAFKYLNPYNIFVYRNPNDVAKSLCNKRSDVKYDDALYAAEWRYDYMKKLQEEHPLKMQFNRKFMRGCRTAVSIIPPHWPVRTRYILNKKKSIKIETKNKNVPFAK